MMKFHKRSASFILCIMFLIFAVSAVSGCSALGRQYDSVDMSEQDGRLAAGNAMDLGSKTLEIREIKPEEQQTLKLAIAETEVRTEEETTEAIIEEEGFTLLFAGDVYFSDHVLNAYNQAGGIHGVLDEGIRDEIAQADIFMVNQEFPFTSRGTAAADKQFTFRLPPERVSMMNEMGIDIVTMANNHILDFGPDGIADSLAALDAAGILHVGAGEDLEQAKKLETVAVNGKTIGFLGASRVYMSSSWAAGPGHPGVFSTYDPAQLIAAIKEARELCDYLVVYVHWGVERETTPQSYQRTMGRQFIDAGADIVIGSHPHVLQETEYYDGKPIVHSLGNFVFGSSIPETKLLKVEVSADGEVVLTDILGRSSAGYTRLR